MADSAHAAATHGPEPHESVPGLGDGKPRVVWPGLATDKPVATALGPQATAIGAGVSGDGEGAPEFPSASCPGCMRALARPPTASTSSCGSASSRSSGTIEAATQGVFDITKQPSLAITAGALVFWDDTNRRITTTATGNFQVGIATQAALAADTTVRVWLNRVPPSGS